jgi:hypothetical protein
MDAIGDLVYSLFGAEGQILFREYSTLVVLVGLAVVAGAAFFLLLLALRVARSGWQQAVGDLPLLLSGDGRRALQLAREIRRGSKRLRRMLLTMEEDAREHPELPGVLERFVRRQLPEALAQIHSFIETGGTRPASALERLLAKQERTWAEAADDRAREQMERAIAETRQRLLQVRQSNTQRAHLLHSLEEAALALRTLELEMASLGATRSQAMSDLRDQLADVAEGLHHQQQVHAEFRERN